MTTTTATKTDKVKTSAKGKVNKADKPVDPRPRRLQRSRARADEARAILGNRGWLGEYIDAARTESILRAKVADALKPPAPAK